MSRNFGVPRIAYREPAEWRMPPGPSFWAICVLDLFAFGIVALFAVIVCRALGVV